MSAITVMQDIFREDTDRNVFILLQPLPSRQCNRDSNDETICQFIAAGDMNR